MAARHVDPDADVTRAPAGEASEPLTLMPTESGGRPTEFRGRLPRGASLAGGRFIIESFLGDGGMGQVYEAEDTTRHERVALKKLHNIDARSINDLKREFRSLVNVAHPNLVTLHELFADDHHWFFVMGFVRGVDFLHHVRADAAVGFHATMVVQQMDPNQAVRVERTVVENVQNSFFEHGLRDVLRQLAAGVQAIHAAGKLHRDLKPSNVLVTPEGRVVILDFGLVADQQDLDLNEQFFEIVGTPHYMAPEQARGHRALPASDWYAVGAMLFEALTGESPFRGPVYQVLADKLSQEAPAPSSLVAGIPPEIDRLCADLLRRNPEDRPSEREIFERLGALSSERSPRLSPQSASSSSRTPFVGRNEELSALHSALDATRANRPVIAFVRGLSGMGKTTLVERFLKDVRRTGEALVLSGRCYERESVRYNAFDGIVDALCEHLGRWPETDEAPLELSDLEALIQAFPAFSGVSSLMRNSRLGAPLPPDPHEIRRRAFGAFRELLTRLASKRLLVVHVDDLQWADMDSAKLMQALMSPPEPPAMLFVGTYRSDEVDKSPFLREVSNSEDQLTDSEIRTIDVGPLRSAEEMELVAALQPEGPIDVESIRREAMGSPYFIAELLRYATDNNSLEMGAHGLGNVTFDQALLERISRLPEDSRRALAVIAVATAPIARGLLARAMEESGDLQATLTTLRAANLVRPLGAGGDLSIVTTYHDRIRETVCRTLPPEELRTWHLSLANAIEGSEGENLEALTDHLVQAREHERAGRTAARAAQRAATMLAFERAAKLYLVAIEHGNYDEDRTRELRAARAEALVNAGRCADAANDYFAAAEGAAPREASNMRRRAAVQLLRSGHVDRGISILADALADFGLELPEDAAAHFARLGQMFRQRGLAYEERKVDAISETDLARIDVCWEAAIGLATISASRAGYMTVHTLLYALDAGEPFRILRGLAMYVMHTAAVASRGSRTIRAVLNLAQEITERIDSPEARGWWAFTRACADFWTGRAAAAAASFGEAEATWRYSCVGVSREIAQARYLMVQSLLMTGRVDELATRVPGWITEAEERDDLYLATVLRSVSWPLWLGANDPDRAESEVVQVGADLPRVADHAEWMVAVTYGHVDLYRGDAEYAWTRLSASWDGILGSTIAMLTVGRATSFELHARLALARAVAGIDVETSVAIVESDANEVASIELPCFLPRALMLRAGIATLQGGAEGRRNAVRLLERAERDFVGEAGNPVGAACARRRRGQLSGPEGRNLVREADGALRALGITNPARWADMYAPGRY